MLGLELSVCGRLFWYLNLMAYGHKKEVRINLTPNLMTLSIMLAFFCVKNSDKIGSKVL